MLRGFLIVLVIVLLVGAGWLMYNRGTTTSLGDGTVVSRDASVQKEHMDSGDVDIDGRPASEAMPSPSRSDAPGTINTEPVNGTAMNPSQAATNQPPAGMRSPATTAYPPSYPGTVALPVGDTIAPNPPNGLAFGGTGKFQWYRQGSLTWRVDTNSGSSCIAFATLDEWRKAIVYMHGCGNA